MLARNAWPSPNPRVGAVIVRNGRIIGMGRHETAGTPHAEVNAITSLSQSAREAQMFVTLEPCCHTGRTGPCTKAILDAGITTVYVGQLDANPAVAGKGVQQLQEAGVTVITDVLPQHTRRLVAGHQRFMTEGLPYVTWKYAMTLDGKVATKSGASKWITSSHSRLLVHKLRQSVDAVITGVGTVLEDDPVMDVRLPAVDHLPVRVVFDSEAKAPASARALQQPPKTVVVTGSLVATDKLHQLQSINVDVIRTDKERADPRTALKVLASDFGVREVLLECGPTLAASFLAEGLINEGVAYVAPSLFGSAEAPGPLAGVGVSVPAEAKGATITSLRCIGPDIEIRFTL